MALFCHFYGTLFFHYLLWVESFRFPPNMFVGAAHVTVFINAIIHTIQTFPYYTGYRRIQPQFGSKIVRRPVGANVR